MNRHAVSTGRVALWALALLLGALAASGLSNLAPIERTTNVVWLVGPLAVFGFVSSCVIAAVESLIPAMRSSARTARRGTIRHP
jgi:MFS family permease